jgi:quercetin dioxygenase-like cupin family protein
VRVRRVVTGHDESGSARVVVDDVDKNGRTTGEGNSSVTIWSSDRMPCDISKGVSVEDMGARSTGTPPAPNGTRFIVTEMPPGAAGKMHRTETIDYVIVLAGEIELALDTEVVKAKAGDALVLRGTNHAWANRGTVPARMASVLVDAEPLGIGHPVPRGQSAGQWSATSGGRAT